ncbi:hypothetical protein D3C80_1442660 [compost metagenome]
MGVVVDQAGQDALALEIDYLRVGTGKRHDLGIGADLLEQAILDGDGRGIWIGAVERGDPAVMENGVGIHRIGSGFDGIGSAGRREKRGKGEAGRRAEKGPARRHQPCSLVDEIWLPAISAVRSLPFGIWPNMCGLIC